jgi:predicted secreted hydrolase
MNGDVRISRRAFGGGLALLAFGGAPALAQGFAGLGRSADGYAEVKPGRPFAFPADHGPHPDFRIEWWYVTANLTDASGAAYGTQWTLFRQALQPGAPRQGWDNQQVWLGHAAVTRADTHRFAETVARGGVGQAGVETKPFRAFIDAWQMRGSVQTGDATLAPLELQASARDFSYDLRLAADRPLILQGDAGYSRKSEREQASYYYSQPFFTAAGNLTIDGKAVDVTGKAWMDREWSSQPLAPDQSGWDWFALHLDTGDRLMLYRMRQTDGRHYASGTWIAPDGQTRQLAPADIEMTPQSPVAVAGRQIPVRWRVAVPALGLAIDSAPLNPLAWMGTSYAYWEGPIGFSGSHSGVGYLEMTGY